MSTAGPGDSSAVFSELDPFQAQAAADSEPDDEAAAVAALAPEMPVEPEPEDDPLPADEEIGKDQFLSTTFFAFAGEVVSVSFEMPQQATIGEVIDFFQRHGHQVPRTIGVGSDGLLTLTVAAGSLRCHPRDVIGAIQAGSIPRGNALLHAVAVAQKVYALGLAASQARGITRAFVRDLETGMRPYDAQARAYAQAVMAATMGPDPLAEALICKGNALKYYANHLPLPPGTTSAEGALEEARQVLEGAYGEALKTGDFSAAYDARERFASMLGPARPSTANQAPDHHIDFAIADHLDPA